jgi:4,5-DOPA dioxygenase extradiol
MTSVGSLVSSTRSNTRHLATPCSRGAWSSSLKPTEAILDDESWGLDHGTWSVLTHVFPDADIPVVQLSVDETQPPSFHYELGGKLAPLRGEGVLVIGSGNLVHNLHAYSWGRHPVEPFEWAVRFETEVRRLLEGHEHGPLVDYENLGPDALLSVPRPITTSRSCT